MSKFTEERDKVESGIAAWWAAKTEDQKLHYFIGVAAFALGVLVGAVLL